MYKLAILDDDLDWCLAVQRFLRQDFSVDTYQSISSFMWQSELLNQCDALLIDISLPPARHEFYLNGIEIVDRLRKTLPSQPLIVLVTAYMSSNELAVSGKEICPGADSYFAKDTGLEVLARQLKQLLAQDGGTH
ncbi:MAG: response regulator [Pegethrix bostrychoides GSE-TBD4-15B]|jgi:DNA-binding response OmpR family regulator|uniref:Response regulator n=1 Tax=Pegethrix bostrychoides GSE-TBD4-15B TaxID=2839662 RepID=A0A951P9M9_9CYAN|nr:response regulator [Pegethrix bostrychoides GSE-TBD4-15B]